MFTPHPRSISIGQNGASAAARFSHPGLVLLVCGLWLTARGAEPATLAIAIRDRATQEPAPARVHLQDANGKAQRAPGLPFWRDHFVCDGSVTLSLAPGVFTYEIERGPEFKAARGKVMLSSGVFANLDIDLERLADPAAEGWWSGELHVHRSVGQAELLMRAEDLHVAPFITWWNKVNPWTNSPLPKTMPVRFDGNRFYHPLGGEDERDGGALLYFNLDRPLDITDANRNFPSSLVFAEEARRRGAWIDIEKPFWWDTPMWLAHGIGDSVGIAHNHMHRGGVLENEAWGRPRPAAKYPGPQGNGRWTQEIYYHALNCGLRIPPSAGSASGVLPNPVGYDRAYVHVDGELSYEKWFEGLRAGRSFVSNGPLLRCRANGELPGAVLKSPKALPIVIEGKLDSRDPIRAVELVRDGQVETMALPATVTVAESGWFLVRALADITNTFRFASTAPWYVEIDGRAMKPKRESAQFFADWCRERIESLEKLRQGSAAQRKAVLEPWREALKFWEAKLTP